MTTENEKNLDMDIEKVLEEDEAFKEGEDAYERLMEQSMAISEEITSALIKEIVKVDDATGVKANTMTLTTAISATAKTLINLVSYTFDTEDELKQTITQAREKVVNTVIPALLNPQPCGICPECKEGKPCSNPNMDTSMLQTRTLPILCAQLIEYDLWNKILYLYSDNDSTTDKEEKSNE